MPLVELDDLFFRDLQVGPPSFYFYLGDQVQLSLAVMDLFRHSNHLDEGVDSPFVFLLLLCLEYPHLLARPGPRHFVLSKYQGGYLGSAAPPGIPFEYVVDPKVSHFYLMTFLKDFRPFTKSSFLILFTLQTLNCVLPSIVIENYNRHFGSCLEFLLLVLDSLVVFHAYSFHFVAISIISSPTSLTRHSTCSTSQNTNASSFICRLTLLGELPGSFSFRLISRLAAHIPRNPFAVVLSSYTLSPARSAHARSDLGEKRTRWRGGPPLCALTG